MRTLVVNVGELAHISRGDISRPLKGGDMSDKEQHVSERGLGILIEGGIITKISGSDELISEYAPSWDGGIVTNEANVIDANGKAVIPGFVDSHTHLIWDGDRSNEISLRQKGMSYSEIASLGGGIAKTVRSTRQCSFQELIDIGINNVNKALSLGTTTLEAKSGYGLDLETEISILNAYKAIDAKSQCDIHSTWLGAHDVPSGVKKEDYVDELINEQLPLVSQMGIARWADVFCEPGWFTIEESREILLAAKTLGLESRVHVDEFVDSGGLLMASELGSVSADHVACSNDESRATADHAGVMQTFLPGTQYVLGMDDFPPIRDCLENSWAFSIATDFNPNCNSISMPFVGSLATHRCGIDPTAALVACTRNPATTFTDGSKPNIGVLMEGASASMNILNTERVDGWCQSPGMNPISLTIANGNIVKW